MNIEDVTPEWVEREINARMFQSDDRARQDLAVLRALQQARKRLEAAPHAHMCKKYHCACSNHERGNSWLCPRCPCDCWKSSALASVTAT